MLLLAQVIGLEVTVVGGVSLGRGGLSRLTVIAFLPVLDDNGWSMTGQLWALHSTHLVLEVLHLVVLVELMEQLIPFLV